MIGKIIFLTIHGSLNHDNEFKQKITNLFN